MKKNGFTLAEVLLTMGIVGVVTALVLPTVIQNVSTSQVTPKLNKAISMFEQANTALLSTNKVDSLIDSGLMRTNETYGEELKKYLRLSKTDYGYLAKDGISYDFVIEKRTLDDSNPAHKQLIGLVTIDINGKAKPNEQGTDRFNYNLYNDGSLRETYRTAVNAEALEESDIKMVYLPEAVPSTNEEVVIKTPVKTEETEEEEEKVDINNNNIAYCNNSAYYSGSSLNALLSCGLPDGDRIQVMVGCKCVQTYNTKTGKMEVKSSARDECREQGKNVSNYILYSKPHSAQDVRNILRPFIYIYSDDDYYLNMDYSEYQRMKERGMFTP